LIPEAAPTARLEDWILQDPHSAVSTALGALYASLSHSMDEGGGRILAITSAEPGCGTTSIAMALGRIAAREGLTRRVLLIDADFRRADLGGRLQPPAGLGVARAEDGLVEVLAGEVDLAHAIRRDRYTSMDLLPIAGTFSSPVELLATRSMQRLVEVLRQHYDLVIVNTPSVRVFPEAQRMAQLADTSLLVLNWDETSRSALVESVRILHQAGAHIAGTVLNRCGQRQDQRAAQ
jgi:capsular exopolysaccharide synthesis family protein